ncbi:MAG: RNB domain-containing ribonuclease, partial [Proteobacteria bacterium]|nr:RNB domain-containing ribonuclease [Pseudomonadota bacterium]
MGTVVEYLKGDQLVLRMVKSQDGKKLSLTDSRGRSTTLAENKVLFTHSADSTEKLAGELATLADEVDVALLWETVIDDGGAAMLASELAQVYFEEDSVASCSAVFRAALADRLYFRHRRKRFAPRSPTEVDQLRAQREAQDRAARELSALKASLEAGDLDNTLARRLEDHLRGTDDKMLSRALGECHADPSNAAFNLLLSSGRLSNTMTLEEIQADLHVEHPPKVVEHASLCTVTTSHEALPAAFSIDDEDTQEVDDVLTVHQEDGLLRVDIDIADLTGMIMVGDPVDLEARRRAKTVYLPTRNYYMLPGNIGCDQGSLLVGQRRPALRTSVWIDEEGHVQNYEHKQVTIEVQRRLSYTMADHLIASDEEDETSQALRLLAQATDGLAAHRRERGALFIHRREWRLSVCAETGEISVHQLPTDSP